MSETKVVVLVPTVEGICRGLRRWMYGPNGQSTLKPAVLTQEVAHAQPGFVEDIRQYLVEHFLCDFDAPWLVMCDSDTVPRLTALAMVQGAEEAGLQIVAAPVPFHPFILDGTSPRGVHVNFFDPANGGAPIKWHDLPWPAKGGDRYIPIKSAGFGCTLLHRSVLEKMVDAARKGRCEWPMRAEWRNGRLLRTEDIAFFIRAQKMGFRLYADLANPCIHEKRMGLSPEMAVDDQDFWEPGVAAHPNAPYLAPRIIPPTTVSEPTKVE